MDATNKPQAAKPKGGRFVRVEVIESRIRAPLSGASSQDGRTLTITAIGTDEKGQKTNTVTVYDKQSTT